MTTSPDLRTKLELVVQPPISLLAFLLISTLLNSIVYSTLIQHPSSSVTLFLTLNTL